MKSATRASFIAVTCVIIAALALALAAKAGSFLVVEAPQPSDAILVLAGETDYRPKRAIELLHQGYGKMIVLDVPTNATLYEVTEIQLAERYVQGLRDRDLPPGTDMVVCPIAGLSTKDESKDAEECLQRLGAKRVLLVTSDFHTRRALAVFRREFPGHVYSIAASHNTEQFGVQWWKHRQWSKTFQEEWLKMIWWKLVDQWR